MRWKKETASSKVEGLGRGFRVREKKRVERVRRGRELKRMMDFNMVVENETLEVVWNKIGQNRVFAEHNRVFDTIKLVMPNSTNLLHYVVGDLVVVSGSSFNIQICIRVQF